MRFRSVGRLKELTGIHYQTEKDRIYKNLSWDINELRYQAASAIAAQETLMGELEKSEMELAKLKVPGWWDKPEFEAIAKQFKEMRQPERKYFLERVPGFKKFLEKMPHIQRKSRLQVDADLRRDLIRDGAALDPTAKSA